ncbi:MAG: tRNA uridine-5-carboxymethylaminomethyl(34) synthesis GTPase MnmE [Ruminococcaceae bacterium]|nr:tRNA uridine-5-carboxymethylaminomethyl(34) synthesis GTPase MnmE [Oscillospiraceae bacterium]
MNLMDTIAAVSTPYGKGGIAVIRISGTDALSVASKIFKPVCGKDFCDAEANLSYYGRIFSDGIQIDDGIAVYFRAPRSFTGEDTVEISCHGGILITQKVLTAALCAGARAAEAGEFTRRAFINGKMKLSGAEALGNLLDAQTDDQILLARSTMKGILSEQTDKIYNSICSVVAAVFAKIDYPDEDLADLSVEQMLEVTDKNISALEALCATYKTGRAVSEGIPTVITGKTNAGKSSLYNLILGKQAAIVTDIEGTTRDILTETAMVGRVMLKLSDTAGLRKTRDAVEKIGVERAMEKIDCAELILAVVDGSQNISEQDVEFADFLLAKNAVTVLILNKSDKGISSSARALAEKFEYRIEISAQSKDGFDELCKLIEQIYIDKDLNVGSDAIISNSRQHAAAAKGLELLKCAREYIKDDLPLEICCSTLEAAMAAVGELDGRTVSEDIVSNIFANFCVGK